jgi:hypothetical protein
MSTLLAAVLCAISQFPEGQPVAPPPAAAIELPAANLVDGAPERDPDFPKDARAGVFQKIVFSNTWLPRTGSRGLGMDDLQLDTVWGLPLPTRSWPLVITPGFAAHWLDGPAGADLPPRVYDAYTQFRWIPRLAPGLKADLMVVPGLYGDFKEINHKTFRVSGYGAGIWNWTPTLRLVLGAAYYDRRDVGLLPVGGFIWKPHDDFECRLVFPEPKIAHRIYWNSVYSSDVEDWVYVAGEFGSDAWSFQQPGGAGDVATYHDIRLLLGTEHKVLYGLTSQLEVGYVFSRKLLLDSTPTSLYPADTVLVRGGLRY